MLGGLALIALGLLGNMGFSPWVILPFALIGAAAWVFRPGRGAARRGHGGWSWASYFAGLPLVSLLAAAAYGLGWGIAALG